MITHRGTTSTAEHKPSEHSVNFGDSRLTDRFDRIVASFENNPALSFPMIFQNRAGLDGFYRFINNDCVSYEEILRVACKKTIGRIAKENLVVAVHDSTSFDFSHTSNVTGLGRLSRGKKGFFGHFCVGTDLDRQLFGVLGLEPWSRQEKINKGRVRKHYSDSSRESIRWANLVKEVQQKLENPTKVVHVADSEADDYSSFCEFIENGIRFVFRAKYDRKVEDKTFLKLFDSLDALNAVCERQVKLSPRKASNRPRDAKDHPPREARMVKLGISAKRMEICRGRNIDPKYPKTLELHFVRVFEINPPFGESPVEWTLVTSEPIQSESDLLQIVDIYRSRWVIEEFFHALKTGCNFEKRGLEAYTALLRCLAIFIPIACNLYNIKIIGRLAPACDSAGLVNETQIKIITQITGKTPKELSAVGPLMLAIGSIGGHLKHNGLPGWKVLARGYERLLQLEQGYRMATQYGATCDE